MKANQTNIIQKLHSIIYSISSFTNKYKICCRENL